MLHLIAVQIVLEYNATPVATQNVIVNNATPVATQIIMHATLAAKQIVLYNVILVATKM